MRPKVPRVITPVAWLALITYLLLLPGSDVPRFELLARIHFDKIVHVFFLMTLVWLWCRWLAPAGRVTPSLLVLLGGCAYGVAIEFCQEYLVRNRSFDYVDIIADVVGAFAGFWVHRRWPVNRLT